MLIILIKTVVFIVFFFGDLLCARSDIAKAVHGFFGSYFKFDWRGIKLFY